MKILAFVDVHLSEPALRALRKKAAKADILVCCGDVSIFENGLRDILKKFNDIGKEVLIINGNHETEEIMGLECRKFHNVNYSHKKIITRNGVDFVGYGGGGFSEEDQELKRFVKGVKDKLKSNKLVFFTHAPPFGTKLDFLGTGHKGSKTVTQAIKFLRPGLFVCGHLHQNFKVRDRIGQTRMINPGPDGELVEV